MNPSALEACDYLLNLKASVQSDLDVVSNHRTKEWLQRWGWLVKCFCVCITTDAPVTLSPQPISARDIQIVYKGTKEPLAYILPPFGTGLWLPAMQIWTRRSSASTLWPIQARFWKPLLDRYPWGSDVNVGSARRDRTGVKCWWNGAVGASV